MFFFFKQKTAYEMRISDWSSDVCSSDLVICQSQEPETLYEYGGSMLAASNVQHAIFTDYYTTLSYAYQADGLEKLPSLDDGDAVLNSVEVAEEIGRASCRERVCQYV